VGTTAFGGGGFTVWGCFFLNCKIDLYVIDATLRGQQYRDQILRSLIVPHFDGHPLASRPILMDGNARPHNPYSARLSATFIHGYGGDGIFTRTALYRAPTHV
jgi:hypothetical protein